MTDHGQKTVLRELNDPERLIAWAMRVWVVGAREKISADEVLRSSFARAGAPQALPVLDNMMAVVAAGAARRIDISCVCHDRLSPDERTILDAIALFQAGDTLETPLMLRSFLTPEAAIAGAGMMRRLAAVMSGAGLSLRASQASTRLYAIAAEPGIADWSGSMTVH